VEWAVDDEVAAPREELEANDEPVDERGLGDAVRPRG